MNEFEIAIAFALLLLTFLIVTPIALIVGLRRLKARVAAMEGQLAALQTQLQRVQEEQPHQPATMDQAPQPTPAHIEPRATAPVPERRKKPEQKRPEHKKQEQQEEPEFFDDASWAELETAAEETKPSLVQELIAKAKAWLLGGNTVARVGTLLIFFGVAFALKYAADSGWLPIELRLEGTALGGMVLTALGWRLKEKRRGYALILQGAGIGVIYLTVYAAFALYHLVPAGPGLGLMVALVVLSTSLALLQDARSLALLAVTGGFLAPILMSTGRGNHVLLFSYYALLNAGILAVAWRKAWRELNLLGFAFTFGIGAFWGFYSYRAEDFATTEPFLILFFLFYVAVPVLFALRQPGQLKGYVDGTLVFGVPLVASILQSGLVQRYEYGLAGSALVTGLFYTLLASALWRRRIEELRLLVEAFLALAVVFGTLAIPLAVDGRLTGAAWALEGAALVWVGVRQNRLTARLFGLLVQAGAALALLSATHLAAGPAPVFNSRYLSALMIALAALFSAWQLYRHRDDLRKFEVDAGRFFLVWGLLWWLFAGGNEISRHLHGFDQPHALLVFFALSAAALAWLRRRLEWAQLVYPPLLLLPALGLMALHLFLERNSAHPFMEWGLPAWGLALGVQYGLLRFFEEEWTPRGFVRWGHLGGLWLLAFLLAWEGVWLLDRLVEGGNVWGLIAWALVPTAFMAALPVFSARLEWPLRRFSDLYLDQGQIPLAGFAALWVLFASTQVGDPRPLSYLPVLNPLELTQLIVLFILLWRGRAVWAQRRPELVWYGWSAVAFVALNGIIARATHFLDGVPFTLDGLWDAPQFQTALSVTWTVAALAITLAATRLRQRPAWIAGAVLLGAVVIKLFLVDLAGVGTVARIVSFLVVGGLVLLIGYFSPLPPHIEETTEETTKEPEKEATGS